MQHLFHNKKKFLFPLGRISFVAVGALFALLLVNCDSGGAGSSATGSPSTPLCNLEDSTLDCDGDGVANSLDEFGYDITRSCAVDFSDGGNSNSETLDCDNDGHRNSLDIDANGNGLIDIFAANMFFNIRNDLTGRYYDSNGADEDAGTNLGCPAAGCNGYDLATDIDLSTYANWVPIGSDSDLNDQTCSDGFQAILDGNGFRIDNLTISGSGTIGLFGCIADATIRNLTIDVDSIDGNSGDDYIGVLAGGAYNSSSIDRVVVSDRDGDGSALGSGSAGTDYIGGLVGVLGASSTIFASVSLVDIESNTTDFLYGGGLVGRLENDARIMASYSGGAIRHTAGNSRLGGLVGIANGSNGFVYVYNSWANSAISHTAETTNSLGGLVGDGLHFIAINSLSSSILSSANEGNVPRSGGLVGRILLNATVVNSYWDTTTDNLEDSTGGRTGIATLTSSSSTLPTMSLIGLSTSRLQGANAVDTTITVDSGELACVAAGGEWGSGSCSKTSVVVWQDWTTPFDIDDLDEDLDPASGADPESVRYDSNSDGQLTSSDAFIWKFDTGGYPCLRPLHGLNNISCL